MGQASAELTPRETCREPPGVGPTGPSLQPRSHSQGVGDTGTALRPGTALPSPPPWTRGRGAGGGETPLPLRGTQLGRRSPQPEKPRRPAPTLLTLASSRAGGSAGKRGGQPAIPTSLLKVFTASMLSVRRPGARRRKRRRPLHRVESETEAAAPPRAGAPAGGRAAATPGQEQKGKHWRGRAPSGAARRGHGR